MKPAWLGRIIAYGLTPRGIVVLGVVSVSLALLSGVGVWYLLREQAGPWSAKREAQITPPVSLTELAAEYPQLKAVLSNPALDSVYKEFLVTYQKNGVQAALELGRRRGLLKGEEVILTLELDSSGANSAQRDELVAALQGRGVRVTAASGNLIDIAIALDLIDEAMQSEDPGGWLSGIAGLEHIIHLRLPIPGTENSGFASRRSWMRPQQVESEGLGVIEVGPWHEAGAVG